MTPLLLNAPPALRDAAGKALSEGVENRAPSSELGCQDPITACDTRQRHRFVRGLCERFQGRDVAVVAEQFAGAMSQRADHRDGSTVRSKRQKTGVLDEHQGPARELATKPALLVGRAEIPHGCRLIDEGMLE